MADSAVPITSGTGTNIDSRTESTNGNHRQVVVLGDPATNAGVAPVDGTAGLKVDLGADNDVTVAGVSTAANQDTIIGHLDGVEGLLTTIDADTGAIATDTTTIIGHLDGVETVLGTIDADTSNISTKIDTIAGDTTSIQTAVELLDDTVATDGAATPTKGILMAGQDGTNAQTVKTDSDGNLQVDILTAPAVTGSVTANAGTNLNTSALALETGGNLAAAAASLATLDNIVSGSEAQVDIVAAIPAGDNAIGRVKLTDGTDVADILDLTNSNPLTVAIVDGDGTQISSFGGGTQYTEDAAAAGNPVGNMNMAVRADTLAAVTSDDGDNIALRATNKGELFVKQTDQIDVNVTNGGIDIGNFTADHDGPGNTLGAAFLHDETSIDPIGEDETGYARMSENRNQYVQLRDGENAERGVNILGLTNNNAIASAIVDGNGDQITSFGGGTQYTEADTDASITGTAMMMEGAANALVPAQGTAADGLLVNLGANNDVTVAGVATAANQTTVIGHLDGVEGLLTTIDADTGNIATSVANIDADTTTIIGHLDGVEGLLTTIDADTSNISTKVDTIAGDTTSIQTAVELIDDTVAVLGTDTYTEAASKGLIIGAVRRDADTTLVNTTNEVSPLQVDANGRLKVEAFSGETLPVSLTSTTVTGTVAVTQSGTWDEVGINDSGNSITVDDGGTSLTVDYATTGSGTATGALRVELPTNGTGVIATVGAVTAITNALPAGTNAIGKLAANSGVDIGDVDVTSISAGTNLIGDVGIQPRTTNGLDTMNATSSDGATALTSTVQAIKASAGKLYGYYIYNPNSTAQFVQFYNTASGSVTVGTTSPLFMLTIPATSGANLFSDIGITFGTAISWAATSTAGGNGAPTTALDAVAWYK